MVKLASNENPWGPSEAMMQAMQGAWKYSNRYGYPDADIERRIADHHGVGRDHILMGAGSGELLEVVGLAFLEHGKKVVGVEPTFNTVYRQATSIDAEAILLPLNDDHTQNIDELIETTRRHYREVGLVYFCNPNNPTGVVESDASVRRLLDGIPEDVPVLIDEAYHHFVEDPAYATSLPYVLEGRPVIITRTFSKIYGMAGMRLGYAIARPDLIDRMSPFSTGTVNALVKWGGAAALDDTEYETFVRSETLRLRKRTVTALEERGYEVIPSETNFFMVHTGQPAARVREQFRNRGVAVGRDFPPMLDHLRVSVGSEEEMDRFMRAWDEIFVETAPSGR
jgi:histidinol-phosphate aminotransferase